MSQALELATESPKRRGNVVVAVEQRFERTPDGAVWAPSLAGQSLWARYLQVFDSVSVLARITRVDVASPRLERCDSDRIHFVGLPYYIGPWGFIKNRRAITAAAVAAVDPASSVILRVPSPIASCLSRHLRRIDKPYAVEVIGDPFDVMSTGAIRHPLRPLFRVMLTSQLKNDCRHACAAAYVTQFALQRRYPCKGQSINVSDVELGAPGGARGGAGEVYTTHYSTVALTECVTTPRTYAAAATRRLTIATIGSLAQMYKGVDVLIDAVAACTHRNRDLSLVVIGEGRYRDLLERRAKKRGIAGRVRFTGQLRRDAVTSELDAADMFVLPSRCEGLPRALIEAMARGLPCIASDVGGIPELLHAEDLVQPGSVGDLATAMERAMDDVGRRERMSARNLCKAMDYLDFKLDARRTEFYRNVRAGTDQWLVLQPTS